MLGGSITLHAAMMGFERSDDYQPLFWVNGRPVHVTALLVILHSLALVVSCLMRGFFNFDPQSYIVFSSYAVLHGAIWQVLTYVFAHQPSIWFLLDMAFLFIWGREVERFFGRKIFAALYVGLVLVGPVFLLGRALVQGGDQQLFVNSVDGSLWVHTGLFVVFATLYPNVQFFFGIACTWIAAAFVTIETLQCLGNHWINDGIVLWLNVGFAFFATRYAKVGTEAFSMLGTLRERFPQKTVPLGVKPRLKPRRLVDTDGGGSEDHRGRDVHESVDPLLDKISKHGLASLTNSERAVLEKARVSLLRKDRQG